MQNVSSSDYITNITTKSFPIVDKTIFIEKLLKNPGLCLISRPHGMGKTFNISMASIFFDQNLKGKTEEYFKNTYILEKCDIWKNYMNDYPVVTLSFGRIFFLYYILLNNFFRYK